MKISDLIGGLTTLAPYYAKGLDGYYLGAEHDVIHAYPTDTPLKLEDLEKMAGFGWFQPDVKPEEADEWLVEHYDPDEGWAAFT